jgi:hypothetical protein
MTADQINAYGLLAEALTHRAYDKAGTFGSELPTTTRVYCHDGMSTFENVVDCLEVLTILKSLGGWEYTFLVEPGDAKRTAEINKDFGPTLDDLLAVFLDWHADYGSLIWRLSDEINVPFDPGDSMRAIMDSLVKLDYAALTQGKYLWTDRAVSLNVWGRNVLRYAR